jgi:Fic family protein
VIDRPPYWRVVWDDELEQLPATQEVMAVGYMTAVRWMRDNAAVTPFTIDVISRLHRMIFQGAFPRAAGVPRGTASHVEIQVSFGDGYSGVHYRDVVRELEELARTVNGHMQDIDRWFDESSAERHREDVITAAAWVHGEIVRIHPFVNGNGRVARACINFFAQRYRFRPLILERDRADNAYLIAIDYWVGRHSYSPMIDYLRTRLIPV